MPNINKDRIHRTDEYPIKDKNEVEINIDDIIDNQTQKHKGHPISLKINLLYFNFKNKGYVIDMLSNFTSKYLSDFISFPKPKSFIHSTNASDLNHTSIKVDMKQDKNRIVSIIF